MQDLEIEPSQLSQQLLEKEKAFRLKNQQITSQVNQAFQKVESGLKEGAEMLHRSNPAPSLSLDMEPKKKSIKLKKVKENAIAPAHEDEAMTGTGGATEEALGQEATNRFLKAKLHVLQQELESLVQERQENGLAIALLTEKLKISEEARAKEHKQVATLEGQLAKTTKAQDDAQEKLASTLAELARVKKENENQTRQNKQSEQEMHARDVKLNRALDEVERLKSLSGQKEAEFKDKLEAGKRTAEDLFAENKRLQKQKAELLNGFKKQCQLIEVLKRQKMHVEAAKILQFTEEEFMRTIN
ncbi:Golgin sub A member 2 [Kappamyces sp. JEL0829]|nr:Golgin sub A member 2 [Kappamyces sp. JEL0829]